VTSSFNEVELNQRTITLLYDQIEDLETTPNGDPPVYQEVKRALLARGHSVETMAATADVEALVASIRRDESDVIFNLCESLGGVDAHAIRVAALLELLGKPFTGTGSFGMTLAQDKALAKKIFSFHGIQYPRFSIMESGQVAWSDELQFPLFVKPSNTDSSVGIDEHSLVRNVKELMERISFIQTEVNAPVLIEEFIDGREIFVGVIANENTFQALPIIEWDFSKVTKGPKFATQEAKWDADSEGYKAPEVFPVDIPEAVYERIQAAAVDACRALHVLDYGRVDMRVRRKRNSQPSATSPDDWEFFVIEVNPNPYLEERSEVALAARKSGIEFDDLIERIVHSAIKRTLTTSAPA
jgi:D-alanine-D-alanine ligase